MVEEGVCGLSPHRGMAHSGGPSPLHGDRKDSLLPRFSDGPHEEPGEFSGVEARPDELGDSEPDLQHLEREQAGG